MCTVLQDDTISAAYSVKNTFLDLRGEQSGPQRRNKSLPPSFRPGCGAACDFGVDCSDIPTKDSDVSTDVRTEVSDDDWPPSEFGTLSSDALSSNNGYFGQCEPCMGFMFPSGEPISPWAQVSQPDGSPVAFIQPAVATFEPQGHQKLSAKATAFKPRPQVSSEELDKVASMIEATKKNLENSRSIASVDAVHTPEGWSIVIVPGGKSRSPVDRVVAAAKDALLKAAEGSDNVYVLGYAAPQSAFAEKPQGFEAQLAVMKSTETACWRIFKRGACHHDADCCKDHPSLQVPVQVYVESAQFLGQATIVDYFKQEVASFVMMVTSMLTSTASAQAFNDQDGQGWRVEVTLRPEDLLYKEHFLAVAKNALIESAQSSSSVYIMGSGAKPFISTSQGFTTMLGEMTDRSQACWDVYMHGCCWRNNACRWKHPQCLMPLNIVLKEISASED